MLFNFIPSFARLVGSAPSPVAGYDKLYPKTDGAWYRKDSAGVETRVFPLQRIVLQSPAVSTTASAALQDKINSAITISRAAKFKATVSYSWNHNSAATDFVGDFKINGASVSTQPPMHLQEPKDVAGGAAVEVPGTGSDQRHSFHKVFYVALAAGAPTIQLQWATNSAGTKASIWDAVVTFEEF